MKATRSRRVAIFLGQDLHYAGKPFHGVEAVAIFGGVDVYASSAIITADCTIHATSVFGGVEIHLPAHVNVEVTATGVFGGVENYHRNATVEGAPTVYVKAFALFGGVDIY